MRLSNRFHSLPLAALVTTAVPFSELSHFKFCLHLFSSVWLLSLVQLFATPWTTACQASLSITNCQSLLKLMSIESVMPPTISSSVVLFSSHLQSFPASGSFLMSHFFTSGGQRIGASASDSVLLMSIQGSFPLGLASCNPQGS